MMALEGIRVIELGIWAAAPAAGALLADWGADVVKIEDCAGGDPLRGLALLLGVPVGDFNPYFEVDNRNKRSIAINLKTEGGRAIAYDLIKGADVFLSNLREEALVSLGMGYQSLSELNPRLVYAYVNGYGQKGAEAGKGGYDIGGYWSRGGFMAQLGDEGSPPVHQGSLAGLGDHPTATYLAGGIALALYVRERTGKGQRVDSSLLGSAVWTMGLNLMATVSLAAEGREFARYDRMKSTKNPLSCYYRTKEGKYLMLLMLQPDRYWSEFCRVLGLEHYEHDPRFATLLARAEHAAELITILDAVFLTRTRDEWIECFAGTSLLYDPINTFADILRDPQVMANDYLTELDHPRAGRIRIPAGPVQLRSTPATIRSVAPEVGEHTEAVLLEMGYDWDKIVRLKEAGAIP